MSQPIYLLSQDLGLLKHWQASWGYDCVALNQANTPLPDSAILVIDLAHPQVVQWSQSQWHQRVSNVMVIAASTTPTDEEGHRLLSAGARAYCHAVAPASLLAQVLAVVAAGEIWAGRSLVQRILAAINHLPAQQAPDLSALSERELETARYAAKGYANKEIARFLNISERTVKAHLTSCYEKLGIADRVQLTLRLNGLN
ncbi:response regulator transcription factor [Chitinibacter fontanus]|uniref:Response regulator transcription factor n=1 Tax=Chitinibacter fontanus TaxID=1737446 RepID=A0A7D5ZC48_9NEIS|nr:response regulator transcription factor [Chitinibacter fontanus]QLI80544.1 response regulator transcription factor [Chitinibacter fontanus]